MQYKWEGEDGKITGGGKERRGGGVEWCGCVCVRVCSCVCVCDVTEG